MKMIPSRELSAAPGKVWTLLHHEGSVVITKDGRPRGILIPTSDETLIEDMQDHVRLRAQRAVSEIRREATRRGTDKLTMDDIDSEIAAARRERRARRRT